MVTTEPSPTEALRELLRAKYSDDGWCLLEEVGDGTGSNRSRSCDAIAFGLWPSRGYEIHGFEIKVSRADWLKELREPAKADFFFRHTDYWWLVAGSADVVEPEELPAGWGLIVATGSGRSRRLRGVVKATKRELVDQSRDFMAAMLQRASVIGISARKRLDKDAFERGKAVGLEEQIGEDQIDRALRRGDFEELQRTVGRFTELTGLTLTRWIGEEGFEKIARRIKLVGEHEDILVELQRRLQQAKERIQEESGRAVTILSGIDRVIESSLFKKDPA